MISLEYALDNFDEVLSNCLNHDTVEIINCGNENVVLLSEEKYKKPLINH